jgi:hypothetical protein
MALAQRFAHGGMPVFLRGGHKGVFGFNAFVITTVDVCFHFPLKYILEVIFVS